MEPWLCSHGKVMVRVLLSLRYSASMEPWLCSHGKEVCSQCGVYRDTTLQWSHGFAAMESPKYLSLVQFLPTGLQWSHGFAAMESVLANEAAQTATSFNGAMALQPWKAPFSKMLMKSVLTLQWSHGFAAMESLRFVSCWKHRGCVSLFERSHKMIVYQEGFQTTVP